MATDGQLRAAVTGSTGLIGRRFCEEMSRRGHVVMAVRRAEGGGASHPKSGEALWDVESGNVKWDAPPQVLVHLAGQSVAVRWTAKHKREIHDSRGPATEKLCRYLAGLAAEQRPGLMIATSAVGIYGDRGDEVLTEESATAPRGKSFLADVCLDWEAATRPAEDAGIRVIHVRIGVVLSRHGGALAKLATPTKLFAGGPVGKGTQFIPWISLTDMTRLLAHLAIGQSEVTLINGVGPAPARQHEFMRTLGKVLHRPTIFPFPAFMVKMVFGQMGEEMLLASLRVISARQPAGFTFEHATLEAAIRAELNG